MISRITTLVTSMALVGAVSLASLAADSPDTVPRSGALGSSKAAGRILLAVPRPGRVPGVLRVQLQWWSTQGRVRSLYHAFTTVEGPLAVPSLAVSRDAQWLAYSDPQYRLHLVHLPTGGERGIGRGLMPQFSADSRFVASVTSSVPLGGPGALGTSLLVYCLRTRALTRLGRPHEGLIAGFSWAPRGNRLAWQLLPQGPAAGTLLIRLGSAEHPTMVQRLRVPGTGRVAGGLTWDADGRGLLYWRFVPIVATVDTSWPRFALMRWALPAGPATTVVPASPTGWGEGLPPAAVLNPRGTLIASLLGGPGCGFDQIVLYRRGRPRLTRHIALPGEPRLVSFAPSGTRFVTVWHAARGLTDVRHATLVDAITGQVRNLGPAVAAFWL